MGDRQYQKALVAIFQWIITCLIFLSLTIYDKVNLEATVVIVFVSFIHTLITCFYYTKP